jgi:hypothetical protein
VTLDASRVHTHLMADAALLPEQGRTACAAEAWHEGLDGLRAAHERVPLQPDDLELLARCAYMAIDLAGESPLELASWRWRAGSQPGAP